MSDVRQLETALGSDYPRDAEAREEGKGMSEALRQSTLLEFPCAKPHDAAPIKKERKAKPKPTAEAPAATETQCCDNCIGGYDNTEVITMDCPDYPDVSNGTIDQVQLRATTRRLGCTFWAAPGTPPKIPNWAWCVGHRSCQSLSSVDGICTKTGKKLKEMTYCPTQHLAEKPPRKCCPTCRHHKAKKTFEETCPRLPELMFKGGKLSAMGLMLETSLKDCEHWQEKPAPVKKKKGKAKPLYQIHIAPSPPDSPALLDCGCKYIANTDVLYGSYEGHGGPQATKEEVIQSVLKDLEQFQKFDSILERDRDPITQKNTNFVDETGEFVIGDFFTSLGSPWPPNAEKRSTSKKSKKPQEETES